MRPDEYEQIVADHFKKQGFTVEVSSYTNDYGVDVFATKGKIKIAIQAKMFGNTARKINRQMVMELHGAKDYFDCSKAVIATDGVLIDNAMEVADKLGIGVINIPAVKTTKNYEVKGNEEGFEEIWEKYVMPLQGCNLKRKNGDTNKIIKVDWSGIERITSNGNRQKIKIEIFKKTVNYLLKNGSITRRYINEEYQERASSGIVLILSNTEIFTQTENPTGLKLAL